jgi:hypothetical protein
MKRIFFCTLVLASTSIFAQKGKTPSPATTTGKTDDLNERVGIDASQFSKMHLNPGFCDNFKKILDAGKDQFTALKGQQTSKLISGVDRPYFFSTIELDKKHKGYIGESEQYPEFELVLSDNRFQSPEMKHDFDTLVTLVKSCLSPDEWIITQKDASNDIYLEGTDYKKLVCRENKSGMKRKFELFMYNNRVKGYWIVEFHIDGIGRLPEKKTAEDGSPK